MVAALFAAAALTIGACGSDKSPAASDYTAFCSATEVLEQLGAAADVANATPDEIKDRTEAMSAAAQAGRESAPAEIAADVDFMVKQLDKILELYATYDYDFAAISASPEALTLRNDEESNATNKRLQAYIALHCS